ncbi:hypothetical protein [Kiloniella sp. b19]|uniref:hypothetical protein n=1 Tax=Kiloniella sp. GXU_MW_B19 TaxID=3141326 RepID=UPI0031D2FF66
MSLLHLSLPAAEPERIAIFLAELMGGRALPFPPFPDSWIAFGVRDDGTAVEVYPLTHRLTAGEKQVICTVGEEDKAPSPVHLALASSLSHEAILAKAEEQNWLARLCNRGPFECVEIWLENRLLIEVLDPEMQESYRTGMTMKNWERMFGLSG